MPSKRTQLLLVGLAALLTFSAGGWFVALPHGAPGGSGANSLPVVALVPGATGGASGGTSQDGTEPAATGSSAAAGSGSGAGGLMPADLVSSGWLSSAAAGTGIPGRVLQAYAAASIVAAKKYPDCHLGWNTLAGIGEEESAHGTTGGAHIDADGHLSGSILGPVLDGGSYGKVPDTDHGTLDGDSTWDRAVGPMQILPSTWAAYGADGNGDGVADPNDIDDAALTAADYLCTAGGDLSTGGGWATAINAYNPSQVYVTAVRDDANLYAREGGA